MIGYVRKLTRSQWQAQSRRYRLHTAWLECAADPQEVPRCGGVTYASGLAVNRPDTLAHGEAIHRARASLSFRRRYGFDARRERVRPVRLPA